MCLQGGRLTIQLYYSGGGEITPDSRIYARHPPASAHTPNQIQSFSLKNPGISKLVFFEIPEPCQKQSQARLYEGPRIPRLNKALQYEQIIWLNKHQWQKITWIRPTQHDIDLIFWGSKLLHANISKGHFSNLLPIFKAYFISW